MYASWLLLWYRYTWCWSCGRRDSALMTESSETTVILGMLSSWSPSAGGECGTDVGTFFDQFTFPVSFSSSSSPGRAGSSHHVNLLCVSGRFLWSWGSALVVGRWIWIWKTIGMKTSTNPSLPSRLLLERDRNWAGEQVLYVHSSCSSKVICHLISTLIV